MCHKGKNCGNPAIRVNILVEDKPFERINVLEENTSKPLKFAINFGKPHWPMGE
jgi:hypothetical protein